MGPLESSKIVRSEKNLNAFCSKDCNPSLNHDGKCNGACFLICPRVCKTLCVDGAIVPPLPKAKPFVPLQDLPHPASETRNISQNNITATSMIIAAVSIGAVVLGCILCAFLTVHYLRQRRERRGRIPPIFFGTQEDFLDQDQEPVIDHHIWYINTIGLQQAVIDSIAVFKYKKHESLIEGTDCSVCLNEFQEDDSLRLLPKCSHAFHIPCIDTWLKSHKNCPLCRAPIVSNNFDVQVGLSVPTLGDLSSRNDFQMENSENNNGGLGEDGANEVRNGDNIEDETMNANLNLRNHCRVQSDLVENRKTQEDAKMQPMRRSVSLDSSSAMVIRDAVANHIAAKGQENLPMKYSKSKNVSKRSSSGNLGFGKLKRSSSIGHVLQKGPTLMKRSFSSTVKSSSSSLSRRSGSQDSIFPL